MVRKCGIIGLIHPELSQEKAFVLEINLSNLLKLKTGKMKYKDISKFPSIKKDLALVVDTNIQACSLANAMKKAAGNKLESIEVFDVYEGKGIEEGKKSLAFSLTFTSFDKTLTDEEINPILEKIIQTARNDFKATLRS